MDECDKHAGTRSADRVTERDAPAADVELVFGDAQFLDVAEDLSRERLVDLEEIDVRELEAGLLDRLAYAGDRGGEDVLGRHATGRVADDLDERLEPQRLGLGVAHDDGGGSAVGDLARVLCMQDAERISSRRKSDEHKKWADIVVRIPAPRFIYVFNEAWQEFLLAKQLATESLE